MRVLQIHTKYLEKGGEDTVVVNERALLQKYGHTVELCEFDNKNLEGLSKLTLLQRTIYNKDAYQKVVDAIQNFSPDVIHVHNLYYEASPSVLWAIGHSKVPAVMTLHNFRFACVQGLLFRNNEVCTLCIDKNSILDGIKHKCFQDSYLKSVQLTTVNKLNSKALFEADPIKKYIFLAEYNKNQLSKVLPIKNDNWVVKPNYVEDRGISTYESRSDFYLFVGRLNEQKGIHLLVDAFIKQGKRLEVIGSGPLDNSLAEKVVGHENIILHGQQKSDFIISRLKECRALILPTMTMEGQPMTVLEAFSTGTPAFASNVRNLDSMIVPGYNGFLFETGDMEHLISAINHFEQLESEHKKSIYTNARSSFNLHYSPEGNYNQLLAIYKSILPPHYKLSSNIEHQKQAKAWV